MNAPSPMGLEVDIRRKAYPAAAGQQSQPVIQGLQFTARPGEFIAILGPSGCGKTTLLNILAGLDPDFDGSVRLPDRTGGGEPRVGYVFQNMRLLPWRTVMQNVMLPLPDSPDARARAEALLAEMQLGDVHDAYPERLSIGMQRRVALARAFAHRPDMLLMDEPFVSLDEPTAARLRLVLHEIWRAHPTTVLFVTHDSREALQLADRVVILSPRPSAVARIVEPGLPPDMRNDPLQLEARRQELFSDLSVQ